MAEQSEVDLVSDDTGAVVDETPTENAEPAGEPQATQADAAKPAEAKEEVADKNAEPTTVPYKQFSRTYREVKEKEREIQALRKMLDETSKLVSSGSQKTEAAPEKAGAAEELLQKALLPVLTPLQQQIAEITKRDELREAKLNLAEFWTENRDFEDIRSDVDRVYLEAVQNGARDITPELILNVKLGERHRTDMAARRSLDQETVAKVASVNRTATAERGSTAVPRASSNKKFSEKTIEEMEADLNGTVIWRRGNNDDE